MRLLFHNSRAQRCSKLSGGPVDAGISELLIEVSESGFWSLLSSKAFSSFSEEASFLVLSRFNDFSYNLLHFMSIANYPTSCTTTSPPTIGDMMLVDVVW